MSSFRCICVFPASVKYSVNQREKRLFWASDLYVLPYFIPPVSCSSFDSFVISSSPFLFPLLFSVFVLVLFLWFPNCFVVSSFVSCLLPHFHLLARSFVFLHISVPSLVLVSWFLIPVLSLSAASIPVSSSVSSLLSSLVSFAVSLSHSFFLFLLTCFLLPFLHLFPASFPVCSTVSCNLYYIPNTSAVSSPVS